MDLVFLARTEAAASALNFSLSISSLAWCEKSWLSPRLEVDNRKFIQSSTHPQQLLPWFIKFLLPLPGFILQSFHLHLTLLPPSSPSCSPCFPLLRSVLWVCSLQSAIPEYQEFTTETCRKVPYFSRNCNFLTRTALSPHQVFSDFLWLLLAAPSSADNILRLPSRPATVP